MCGFNHFVQFFIHSLDICEISHQRIFREKLKIKNLIFGGIIEKQFHLHVWMMSMFRTKSLQRLYIRQFLIRYNPIARDEVHSFKYDICGTSGWLFKKVFKVYLHLTNFRKESLLKFSRASMPSSGPLTAVKPFSFDFSLSLLH